MGAEFLPRFLGSVEEKDHLLNCISNVFDTKYKTLTFLRDEIKWSHFLRLRFEAQGKSWLACLPQAGNLAPKLNPLTSS